MNNQKKELNIWYDNLIWCPSQCYYYFMHNGNKYCIYLRWRHQDPWTVEVVRCEEGSFRFCYDDGAWKFVEVPHFKDDDLGKLKEYVMARLDIIMDLWPHCENHISLNQEECKTEAPCLCQGTVS